PPPPPQPSCPTRRSSDLALAAVDTALWDLRCQRNAEPLWIAAGGYRQQMPAYDTEHGWLHLGEEELVEGMRALAAEGWSAAKMKDRKSTRLNSSHVSIAY